MIEAPSTLGSRSEAPLVPDEDFDQTVLPHPEFTAGPGDEDSAKPEEVHIKPEIPHDDSCPPVVQKKDVSINIASITIDMKVEVGKQAKPDNFEQIPIAAEATDEGSIDNDVGDDTEVQFGTGNPSESDLSQRDLNQIDLSQNDFSQIDTSLTEGLSATQTTEPSSNLADIDPEVDILSDSDLFDLL